MTVAAFSGIDAIVLDIEGTTGATAYVHDVLFPYASAHFDSWLAQHGSETETAAITAALGQDIGVPDPSRDLVLQTLAAWVAEDRKAAPLKTLQGLIWQQGFDSGELTSHFFDDALVAIRRWHDLGLALYVYSSGSVLAQRNWYGHTPEGDLTAWISGYFDTVNAGPKRESASYATIAAAIGRPPTTLLFCTDVVQEYDAAVAAGWQAVRVRRQGEPAADVEAPGIPTVSALTDITLTA